MTIKPTLKVKLLFIASLLYSLLILTLSLVNLKKMDVVKLHASDKLYHGVCYAIMMLLWSLYLSSKLKKFHLKQKISLSFAIIVFGIIIEVFQLSFTNYRTFDWWDALANTAGVFFGFLCFSVLQKQFNL